MRENLILYNPASELEVPKPERRLPKHTLTAREAGLWAALEGEAEGENQGDDPD